MYEKITGYLDSFENGTASDDELRKKSLHLSMTFPNPAS